MSFGFGFGVVALLSGGLGAEVTKTPEAILAFVDQHCADCHDDSMKEGDLDLYSLGFDLTDKESFKKWMRVFERVKAGEMPPGEKRRLGEEEKKDFLAHVGEPLRKLDAADVAKNGRVRGRRLTRVEYEHTLHDLLGIDIPLKTLLPEDGGLHGFETVASAQQLSHHQMARYLDVADLALDEAFRRALEGDEVFKKRFEPKELAHLGKGNNRSPELRDGRSLSWPITLQFFGKLESTVAPEDGWYRVTLHQVQAINPLNGVVWGTLRSGACVSNDPMLNMLGLVEATAKERDIVFEAWIEEGHMLELKPNDRSLKRPDTGAPGGNVSFKGRDLEKDGFNGIAHRGVTMERIYPVSDRAGVMRRIFGAESKGAMEKGGNGEEQLRKVVTKFARKAFRRPVGEAQVEPYVDLGLKVLDEGGSFPEALRASYRAVLCSPRFLTFVEPGSGELDDHAVATRLSYALWVSMPDEVLSRLADEGKLRDKKVLAEQVERMLADAKVKRFVHGFTDQWLKLKEIDFTNPDARLFPLFDPVLQESMVQETRAFVRSMVEEDLQVSHLVDSDFAFMNERLVRHYYGGESKAPERGAKKKSGGRQGKGKGKDKGKDNNKDEVSEKEPVVVEEKWMPEIEPGKGLQKVALRGDEKRGGLVAQGAILKVTADGTSTSPVVRGVFVNERILGAHLPPPPPGVAAIEPDIRGATSIRDQLEKHRSNMACATCHYTIDPPGLALESFDPVGVWRTGYGRDNKGAKIDPSGVTPDGEAFEDFMGWKRIYAARGKQLAQGFVQQFITYATGAPGRLSDRSAIDAVVAGSEEAGYGMRTLIRESILSEVFLRK